MAMNKRFMEHLAAKGVIPKQYAMGGYAHNDDEWMDDAWNDHDDDSGEPMTYNKHYMDVDGEEPNKMNCGGRVKKKAFGGRIEAKEVDEPEMDLMGEKEYGYNFQGPEMDEEEMPDMEADEIKKYLAKSLSRKMKG